MSTMRDPLRLVADVGCPESQRALLRHGVDIAPPRDAEARVWLALVGATGAAAAVGGSADASAKTVTTVSKTKIAGLGGAKIGLVVATLAALGALVALGTLLISPRNPRPPTAAPPAPAAAVETPPVAPSPQPAAVGTAPWEEAPPPPDAERTTAPDPRRPARVHHRGVAAAVPPATTTPSPATRLREETTFIRDARLALRAGDTARALRVLDECRRLFPAGALQQERERLVIEALVKEGRAAEASARATHFLRRYPDSPHAVEIRALGFGGSGGGR